MAVHAVKSAQSAVQPFLPWLRAVSAPRIVGSDPICHSGPLREAAGFHRSGKDQRHMKVGIVGLAGAGKTTIFNALTGLRAETGPGGKRSEHMGVIKVPDERVDKLGALHASKKLVFAEVTFVDVAAGPDMSAGKGALPRQVIAAMQGCDALVLVLRAFANPALSEPPDALRDLRTLQAELILSDLGPLENRRERLKKEPGRPGEKELLQRCLEHLESERALSSAGLSPEQLQLLAGFGLLSIKPLLYLLNQEEGDFTGEIPPALAGETEGLPLLALSGKIEMDIAELSPEEQPEFLAALGLERPARDRFVQAAYGLLELISFLTTGPDESRAWPIRRGTTAVKAAGRIHSDIERGFIRAEVIAYDELVRLGGEKQAREAGKLRLEGKDYVVQDGDVIEFRFNV
jgi:ribosome-binding ATPase